MASVLWLPLIFLCSTLFIYSLGVNLPKLHIIQDSNINRSQDSSAELRFPSNLSELKALGMFLNQYTSTNPTYVLTLFCSGYIYKQTFAIPGSVFLNILAGSLFGVWFAFPLTCILTAVGATNCYMLSKFFGKQYVLCYFYDRVVQLQSKIEQDAGSLFLLLLSLRLFPMAPNWLMNITAPVLNIPVYLFFPSVLIGLMPYNFLCVEAGSLLSELTSTESIFTTTTLLKMTAAGVATLIPGLFLKSRNLPNQRDSIVTRDDVASDVPLANLPYESESSSAFPE